MENTQANTNGELNHIKGAIEAVLLINERPISLDQLKRALQTVGPNEIKLAIQSLMDEYEARKSGIKLVEIADGYQLLSNPLYVSYVRELYKTQHKEKLSKPALETIAIIAYKQPVTRMDIELIRGVNSDGVVNHLLNKELIKIVGRKDIPGKPYMYGTTKLFMEYFGLKSLSKLPKLEEFPSLQPPLEQGMTQTEDAQAVEHAQLDEKHQDLAEETASQAASEGETVSTNSSEEKA